MATNEEKIANITATMRELRNLATAAKPAERVELQAQIDALVPDLVDLQEQLRDGVLA